ncbi:MAG TPA: hypothetical protein H9903_10545 [Candidatus Aquabacterium excrementipullorum]|nr:hypothetical protein [Candidatus Aquabacterium excrementipullorum]
MKTTIALAPLLDVRHLLMRAVHYAVDGPCTLEEITDGCAVFSMCDQAGRIVGAFALQCLTDADGTVMHVNAAGGLPGQRLDLAGDMAAFVESEARHRVKARAVRCATRRRGLVKRLQRAGYRVHSRAGQGYVMQKEI